MRAPKIQVSYGGVASFEMYRQTSNLRKNPVKLCEWNYVSLHAARLPAV